MPLQQELQDLVTAAKAAKAGGQPLPVLHLQLKGNDLDILEQATLYTRALNAAGLVTDRKPVVLDFSDANNTDKVNMAFVNALHGVLVVRGTHAVSTVTPGVQQLRHMLSVTWDQKNNILIFTGEPGEYLGQMHEMQNRVPAAVNILSVAGLKEREQHQLAEKWSHAKDFLQLRHSVHAPEKATFKKRSPKGMAP